jgi:hypothetical protein
MWMQMKSSSGSSIQPMPSSEICDLPTRDLSTCDLSALNDYLKD